MSMEKGPESGVEDSHPLYERDRDLRLRACDIRVDEKYTYRTLAIFKNKTTVWDLTAVIIEKTPLRRQPNLFHLEMVLTPPKGCRIGISNGRSLLTEDGYAMVSGEYNAETYDLESLTETGYFLNALNPKDLDDALAQMICENVLIAA